MIQTCHRRGVHAIGGMSALIPVKGNPAANEVRKLVLYGCYPLRSMSTCASLAPANVRSSRWYTAVQGGLSTHLTHVATHGHALQAAFEKVRADKLREVQDGHDGTWVAHPGLIAVAKEVRLLTCMPCECCGSSVRAGSGVGTFPELQKPLVRAACCAQLIAAVAGHLQGLTFDAHNTEAQPDGHVQVQGT